MTLLIVDLLQLSRQPIYRFQFRGWKVASHGIYLEAWMQFLYQRLKLTISGVSRKDIFDAGNARSSILSQLGCGDMQIHDGYLGDQAVGHDAGNASNIILRAET